MRGLKSVKAWVIVGALAVVAVLGIGWALIVSPQRSSLDDIQTQTSAQESSNVVASANLARLKKQAESLPAAKAQLAVMKKTIPAEPEIPALVRTLNQLAVSTGVGLDDVTPAAAVPVSASAAAAAAATPGAADGLQEIPVNLAIRGTYQQTEKFLAGLEKLPRGMLVHGFSFDAGAAGPTDAFSSTIQAGVFMNPNLGQKAAAATPAPAPSPSASS